MDVRKDAPEFRPMTIRLETQDDVDQLLAVLCAVAENRINHTPATIRAAADLRRELVDCLNRED